ncbi:MAG: CpXC domain-containing protein [Anaerolineae bacterium]
MAVRQASPVVCPNCNAHYTAPIETIVDVGRDPALKARFLQGELNTALCPQCGAQGNLLSPIFYHDPEKELAFVFVPNALNMPNIDQQKIIGDLTNRVMKDIPAEQQKMYLFNPKTFLTLESMVKAVLEADGITQEVIDRQASKVKLIEEFLKAPDVTGLRNLAQKHGPDLDYEFFEILTTSAHAMYMDGNQDLAQALFALRQHLARWSPDGQEAIKQIDAALGLGQILTREDLLEQLNATESTEEFQRLVAMGRPLLDYAFFQHLTAQIEAANSKGKTEEAEQLKRLRSRILDVSADLDKQQRQAMNKASQLLTELLQAPDLEQAIRERLDQIDPIFFSFLSANIEEATRQGQTKTAEGLQQLGQMIMALLEENLSPDLRLLNQLVRTPTLEAAQTLLAQNKAAITPDFMQALDELIDDFRANGQAQLVQHFTRVREEAQVLQQGILQK